MASRVDSKGFIRCYGMFWDRNEVDWSPGSGNRNQFRLLGRVGKVAPKLQVCDFRTQRGIYVLYDDHGARYVGLARGQDIGKRLREHTQDHLADSWERFSWFGFRSVLLRTNQHSLQELGEVPARLVSNSDATIGDIEALLIQTLGTYRIGNAQQMKFADAAKWEQVRRDEVDHYVGRLQRNAT
jgi:hypothetical protein